MEHEEIKPNQFQETTIELDGTLKRGGLPINALKIKDQLDIVEKEAHFKKGQKIKVTEVLSGAQNTHFTQLSEYNVGIKDVTISRGVQLPKASLAGNGKIYVIKDMSGSAATTTITISPLDGETIDGDTGDGIIANYGVKRYVSDGSNWFTW